MGLAGRVARGRGEEICAFYFEIVKGSGISEDIDVDGRIILKWN
jgi:hypothetical protein